MEATHCFYGTNSKFQYQLILTKDSETNREIVLNVNLHKKISFSYDRTYNGEYLYLKALDDGKELGEQIDLENDDGTMNDFWYIPDNCVLKHEKDEDRSKDLNLPDQYEFTIRRFLDDRVEASTVRVDRENKMIRLSKFNDVMIFDLVNRIQYDLSGVNYCEKEFNGQYKSYEKYRDLIEIMNKLRQLESTDYVGQLDCRDGLVCDVFSFNSSSGDDSLDDIFSSKTTPSTDIALYTIYFHFDESTKFHHLIQFKKQTFSAEDTVSCLFI